MSKTSLSVFQAKVPLVTIPSSKSAKVTKSVPTMPEQVQVLEPTKIEKLEAVVEGFGSQTESFRKTPRDVEKEEKLRQKLHYLQFFADYDVGRAPASFSCSCCKEIQEIRRVIYLRNDGKVLKKEQVCLFSKEKCEKVCTHPKVKIEKVVKSVCGDGGKHTQEWQEQEKGRQEVRQDIRRRFLAQELGGRRGAGNKETQGSVKISDENFTVKPRKPASPRKGAASVQEAGKEANREIEKGEGGQILVHGESCKTCVRMEKLAGQVLPHSPNY